MAGPKAGTPGTGEIGICHATSSAKNPFVYETPDASGILDGHAKHEEDIIPPFVVVETGGKTTNYPGQNMDEIYGGGFTGAQVLLNKCKIPSGGGGVTETVTTTVTQTVPVTVTVPATTITLPGGTTTKEITVTVKLPGTTVTTPGTTTVVTVPSGQTTTVTLSTRTVTLPSSTVTIGGAVIERDPETVTLPGTTTTVIAGATTTVVTVTGPDKVAHSGVAAAKKVHVTVKGPKRVVRVKAHVVHVRAKGVFGTKKFIVILVRSSRGCPPGSVPYQGHCTFVVRGKG